MICQLSHSNSMLKAKVHLFKMSRNHHFFGKNIYDSVQVPLLASQRRLFLCQYFLVKNGVPVACKQYFCLFADHLVQQQTPNRAIFKELPKPALQHLSTCLELFPGVSRYRIWLMALPEMGAG